MFKANIKHIKYVKLILLIALFFSSCTTSKYIDPIPGTVKKYLDVNGMDIEGYSSSIIGDGLKHYEHYRYYICPVSIEKLWDAYFLSDPGKSFQGKVISFGLVFSDKNGRAYTSDDKRRPLLDVGQIYLIQLRYSWFYSFPVAFLMSEVNPETHEFEFKYLKENFVHGGQRVRLISVDRDLAKPATIVEHYSEYNSGNKLLDAVFYPGFHSRTIDELHGNVASITGVEMTVLDPEEALVLIGAGTGD